MGEIDVQGASLSLIPNAGRFVPHTCETPRPQVWSFRTKSNSEGLELPF